MYLVASTWGLMGTYSVEKPFHFTQTQHMPQHKYFDDDWPIALLSQLFRMSILVTLTLGLESYCQLYVSIYFEG